jgi:hypothetical protein
VRAPDTKEPVYVAALWAFSEANWQEIKESLADCDVDLDAVRVGERFVPGERWWLKDDSTRPLRDALQIMARHYRVLALLPRPTPKQQTEALQKAMATFEEAQKLLPGTLHSEGYSAGSMESFHTLDAALTEKITELRFRIARLKTFGSRSAVSARAVHNDYWRELKSLWLGIVGSAGPLRRKELRKFLVACTPPGLFADMTDKAAIGRATDSFFSNLSRKKRHA